MSITLYKRTDLIRQILHPQEHVLGCPGVVVFFKDYSVTVAAVLGYRNVIAALLRFAVPVDICDRIGCKNGHRRHAKSRHEQQKDRNNGK